IPFVRLDSEGVQQVKQKLPASRNPFTFFEKVIVSMDTLKQDHFVHDLRHHRWDAVVIDESHNVTNQSTQNNKLAHILAPNTDALILASATPHNGSNDSFAQLISLLEPTAVTPNREIAGGATERLMIRRHRYSDSVKDVVGDSWAERRPPEMLPVEPSEEELAVAREIASTWTHPAIGHGPVSGRGAQLFPWTLAKSFLSSPVALRETLRNRTRDLRSKADAAAPEELPPPRRHPRSHCPTAPARCSRRPTPRRSRTSRPPVATPRRQAPWRASPPSTMPASPPTAPRDQANTPDSSSS